VKKFSDKAFILFFVIIMVFFFSYSELLSVTIDYNESTIDFGESWDGSNYEIDVVLNEIGEDIIKDNGLESINFKLVNGYVDSKETWSGFGVNNILIKEIAGYADTNIFGWYEKSDPYNYNTIFEGNDSAENSYELDFDEFTNFGFYIHANGDSENTFYSEHSLNSGRHQVAIFEILEIPNRYILGWEDLDVSNGGDKDYQDMVVSVTVHTAPEPTTLFLFGTGLIGLAGFGRKKFNKR